MTTMSFSNNINVPDIYVYQQYLSNICSLYGCRAVTYFADGGHSGVHNFDICFWIFYFKYWLETAALSTSTFSQKKYLYIYTTKFIFHFLSETKKLFFSHALVLKNDDLPQNFYRSYISFRPLSHLNRCCSVLSFAFSFIFIFCWTAIFHSEWSFI